VATKIPSGLGKILPLDLGNAISVNVARVNVYDSFFGDFTVKAGANATITDSNFAKELTDCTSPLPTNPSLSQCVVAGAGGWQGTCCYGAGFNSNNFSSSPQPTTQVTNGVVTGVNATIRNVAARGATNDFSVSSSSRVNTVTGVPGSALGPGTAGGGIIAGTNSIVSQGVFQNVVAGATCITLQGGNSGTATYNRCAGAPNVGIAAQGSPVTISGNVITGIQGTNAIGINATQNYATVDQNYVEAQGTTGTGIYLGGFGDAATANAVSSNPVDSLGTGFTIMGGSTALTGNVVNNTLTQAFYWHGGAATGLQMIGNSSNLHVITFGQSTGTPGANPVYCTQTFHPMHIFEDALFDNQNSVVGHFFNGGCKGFFISKGANSLVNITFTGDRWIIGGQPLTFFGGAGANLAANYFNSGAGPTTSCDPSCDTAHAGIPCTLDSECGTCGAGVTSKCTPDALWSDMTGSHYAAAGNFMYQGTLPPKQCSGTTTTTGQACDVAAANGSCSGATCTAGTGNAPATCPSGADQGRRCCLGASPTCSARQSMPGIRVSDLGTTIPITDTNIVGNTMFNLTNNETAIDFSNPAGGTITLNRVMITANNILSGTAGGVNLVGIKFPPTLGTSGDNVIAGNNMVNMTTDFMNHKAGFGSISYPSRAFSVQADQAINSAVFTNITDLAFPVISGRQYFFNCEIIFQSNSLTAGAAFAMTAPTGALNFDYISRIPRADVATAGTDVMQEQEGTGNDATPTPTTGVGSTSQVYTAAVRGNLDMGTATSGTLQARVKESVSNHITIKNGANCIVEQIP
jgi:hypothetical protein